MSTSSDRCVFLVAVLLALTACGETKAPPTIAAPVVFDREPKGTPTPGPNAAEIQALTQKIEDLKGDIDIRQREGRMVDEQLALPTTSRETRTELSSRARDIRTTISTKRRELQKAEWELDALKRGVRR